MFFVVYSFVSILGATVDLGLLWSVADTFNGLMSIPNLIALLLLSGTVVNLTKEFFASEKPTAKAGKIPCCIYTVATAREKLRRPWGWRLRALGHGRRVVIVQFLKDGTSGEIAPLRTAGATVYACPNAKFTWLMDENDKAQARAVSADALVKPWHSPLSCWCWTKPALR